MGTDRSRVERAALDLPVHKSAQTFNSISGRFGINGLLDRVRRPSTEREGYRVIKDLKRSWRTSSVCRVVAKTHTAYDATQTLFVRC